MSAVETILGSKRDCTVCDGNGFKYDGRNCGGCGATGEVHSYPKNVRDLVFALSWERMVLLQSMLQIESKLAPAAEALEDKTPYEVGDAIDDARSIALEHIIIACCNRDPMTEGVE